MPSLVASALADAPTDPRILLDAGRVALSSEAYGEAEARFRRSLAVDEESPAAWFGLGQALARAGQADPALAAFERARGLGWSGDLDLETARLHVAAQRVPEARALLQPLASDPHGGSIAEQAAELLQQLESRDED